jgi:serine/threonine-protein kinase
VDLLLDRWLERVAPDGPLWTAGLPPPRASVHSGAAGIACALYRVAMAREDPALLAQADLWAARATSAAMTQEDDAFYAPEREITPEMAGRVSPYHTATGPLCVRALVAHAQGDPATQQRAVERFVAAAREPCANPDLTLGRAGVLLAAALLLDTVHTAGLDGAPLLTLGNELLDGLWREIAPLPAIPDCAERANLGMAHGWAGILYTTLRWCRAAGVPRPPRLQPRLTELANLALARRRGLCWPWRDAADGAGQAETIVMPGWCNGSAGFVYLWVLADRELGDADWRPLAEGAAWNTWEAPDRNGNLCCGLAGRAYALLHLWRHGGDAEWLDRARELADRAAREIGDTTDAPDGLFRGLPGVAALSADLARPETAALPLFEEEGWR